MPNRLVFHATLGAPSDDGDGGDGGGGGSGGGGGGGAAAGATADVVVKFVHGAYGADVHRHAAASRHAPALLHDWPWPGGWRVIVMERLAPEEWAPLDPASPAQTAAARAAYEAVFAARGFVHGDLRASNILVRRGASGPTDDDAAGPEPAAKRPRADAGAGGAGVAGVTTGVEFDVVFLDFDWAGAAGEARYPMLNPVLARVYEPTGARSGALITAAHDRAMLGAL
jgi:hypothetical protein